MSTRPSVYPVNDLDPIRRALGSKEAVLVEQMVAEAAKQVGASDTDTLASIRAVCQSFIDGTMQAQEEPGDWETAIYLLARSSGLLASEYPVIGDWKMAAWDAYLMETEQQLPTDAKQLLKWLVLGRPLKGKSVMNTGCYYAWLEAHEVEQLLTALNDLETNNPDIGDIVDGFHGELVGCLDACRGKALLLVAS